MLSSTKINNNKHKTRKVEGKELSETAKGKSGNRAESCGALNSKYASITNGKKRNHETNGEEGVVLEPTGRRRRRTSKRDADEQQQEQQNPKQPAQQQQQQQQQQRVPDPPTALIRLLQTNKKVLNYFTVLQKYLHQDVQKWKDRAAHYKARLEELEQQQQQQQQQQRERLVNDNSNNFFYSDQHQNNHEITYETNNCSIATTKSKRINNSMAVPLPEEESEIVQKQQKLPSVATGVPITDEMILLELSDEESASSAPAADDDVSEVTMDDHNCEIFDSTKDAGTSSRKSSNNNKVDRGVDIANNRNQDLLYESSKIKHINTFSSSKKTSQMPIEGKEVPQKQPSVPVVDAGKPITDEMILLELSEDDGSSSSSADGREVTIKVNNNNADSINREITLCNEEEEKLQNLQISYLKKAYNLLTELGISLVITTSNENKSSIIGTNAREHPTSHVCADNTSTGSTSGSDDNFSLGEELRKVAKEDVVVNDSVNESESSEDEDSNDREKSFLLFGSSMKKKSTEDDILLNNVNNPMDIQNDPIRFSAALDNDNHERNTSSTKGKLLDVSTTSISASHRRSDFDVARNLMHVVRLLSRKISPNWMPFMGKNHIPCYLDIYKNDDDEDSSSCKPHLQHPAVQGLRYICDALGIMDVWATDTSELFTSLPDDHCKHMIQIGMHRRRELVRSITDTIEMESSFVWSYMDRHARSLTNFSLRYWPDDEVEESENNRARDNYFQLDWSTNMTRLSSIVERCMYAQILSSFYHNRNDMQGLGKVVVDYVCSSVPMLYIEDYPEYPPALSLCVLEALLLNCRWQDKHHHGQDSPNDAVTWFTRYLQGMKPYLPKTRLTDSVECSDIDALKLSYLARALSFSVHSTALIWKLRMQSSNSRVRDISSVEIAAYNRILTSGESSWLGESEIISDDLVHLRDVGKRLLDDILSENVHSQVVDKNYNIYPALKLLLTALAKQDELLKISSRMLSLAHSELMSNGTEYPNIHQLVIIACVKSFMSAICVRHISLSQDLRAELSNSSGGVLLNIDVMNNFLGRFVRILFDYIQSRTTKKFTLNAWHLAASAVLCAITVRDGDQLFNIAKRLVSLVLKDSEMEGDKNQFHIGQQLLQLRPQHLAKFTSFDLIQTLVDSTEIPVIRVINLQRRTDRWTKMIVQASHHQLLLVKAVSPPALLDHSTSCVENQPLCSCMDFVTHPIWGQFAFDGRGSAADFEQNMGICFGGHSHLELLVKSQWQPYMLQPLDRNAKKQQVLVRMDPTERACALSHIFSWRGVERSLTPCVVPDHSWSGQASFLRQFQISGFAKGRAVFCQNKKGRDVPNTPVCVIVEDDALLVDRFSERLEILLNELPCDFHFCSLGYSQPKKAPIFNFSENLGIPTFLWYLTGYILSLEGALYLLKSLPVDGPVDSWVGMQMLSNFATGLSGRKFETLDQISSTLTHLNYLSHEQSENKGNVHREKQLIEKLKFRCFAALTPLCSQQIGGEKSSSEAARSYLGKSALASWRERDTDISYSGYML